MKFIFKDRADSKFVIHWTGFWELEINSKMKFLDFQTILNILDSNDVFFL